MTYEEALNHLVCSGINCLNNKTSDDELRKKCIEALKKQIPKKPIHKHKNYYCPNCGGDGWILWDDAIPNDFDNFCGKCGQRLDFTDDWSDE